jgi:peptidyl-prolyl cis-trans isomerase C
MPAIQTLLRQPLLHFVALGALLFVFYSFSDAGDEAIDENVITVDRAALLTFLQFRAETFNEAYFSEQLDNIDAAQLQSLIDEYYREEALYRESQTMGMDEGDYNIKQRMVEKLVFLLQGNLAAVPAPTEEQLESYYADNVDIYRRPASYSFTHVYVEDQEHSAAGRERAEALLAELIDNNVDFFGASEYGDMFPYLKNYVRRSRDFIRFNFDEAFVEWLDTIRVEEGLWQGPVESPLGFHLVMLSNRFPAEVPPLEDMRERIVEDYYIDQQYLLRRAAEDQLVQKYQLVVEEI